MIVTDAGIDLIARWEGLHEQKDGMVYPYLDTLPTKPIWTIGYGFTRIDGVRVTPDTGPFTHAQCKELLLNEVNHTYAPLVRRALDIDLPDDSFSALVSFCFNLGIGNLRSSTLLRRVNAGSHEDVPAQFLRWNKAGGKVYRGLTRRRQAEAALFMQGFVQPPSEILEPSPSPLVSKQFDSLRYWRQGCDVGTPSLLAAPACLLWR